MGKSFVYLVTISLLISACAVNKTPIPTGGSRADGIIELSYEVGMFEDPVVDWLSADKSASKRCQAWGYKQAEAFEGLKTECQAYNGYGNCVQTLVTANYQCIGSQ